MNQDASVFPLPTDFPILSRATLIGVGGEQGITIRTGDGRTVSHVTSTVPLGAEHVGREAVIANVDSEPVVIGVVHTENKCGPRVDLDGVTLRLTATEELEIVCGKASLVLKKDGTMTIRGTRIISRSSGLHSIFGANVAIN